MRGPVSAAVGPVDASRMRRPCTASALSTSLCLSLLLPLILLLLLCCSGAAPSTASPNAQLPTTPSSPLLFSQPSPAPLPPSISLHYFSPLQLGDSDAGEGSEEVSPTEGESDAELPPAGEEGAALQEEEPDARTPTPPPATPSPLPNSRLPKKPPASSASPAPRSSGVGVSASTTAPASKPAATPAGGAQQQRAGRAPTPAVGDKRGAGGAAVPPPSDAELGAADAMTTADVTLKSGSAEDEEAFPMPPTAANGAGENGRAEAAIDEVAAAATTPAMPMTKAGSSKAANASASPSSPAAGAGTKAAGRGRTAPQKGGAGGAAGALPGNAASPPSALSGVKAGAPLPSAPAASSKRANRSDDALAAAAAASRASKLPKGPQVGDDEPAELSGGVEEEEQASTTSAPPASKAPEHPVTEADGDDAERAMADAALDTSTGLSSASSDEAEAVPMRGQAEEEHRKAGLGSSRKAANASQTPTESDSQAAEGIHGAEAEAEPAASSSSPSASSTSKASEQTKTKDAGGAAGKAAKGPVGVPPVKVATDPSSPPCAPSSVLLSAGSTSAATAAAPPSLTVSVVDGGSGWVTSCTAPSVYLVDVSPLPSFSSPFTSTYRLNNTVPDDDDEEGSTTLSASQQLNLGPELLIAGLPYYVRVRAALTTAAGQPLSVSEATSASPATLTLPPASADEDVGGASAAARVDQCSAVLSLRLSRSAKSSSIAELSAAVRAELLSTLHLTADEADASAFARLTSIERLPSASGQAKEEELELTIAPLQPPSLAVQTRKSAADWAKAVEGQPLDRMLESAPSWLLAELLRSSLANASSSSAAQQLSKAQPRTLQRLSRIGPIRLQCQEAAATPTLTSDEVGGLGRPERGRAGDAAKGGAKLGGSDDDELSPDPEPTQPTLPSSHPTQRGEAKSGSRNSLRPGDEGEHRWDRQPGVDWRGDDDALRGDGGATPPSPADEDPTSLRRPPASPQQPPRVGDDEDYLPPARPPLNDAPGLPITEGEEGDDMADLGAASRPYHPDHFDILPSNELQRPDADAPAGGEVDSPYPAGGRAGEQAGGGASDVDSFSVIGWLLSHTLVAALLVAACMGCLVYAVFFRSSDSAGFAPLQSDEPDVERGDGEGGGRGSSGGYNAGAGPFAALQSASATSASSSSTGSDSLSELDSEQQYHLQLLKHSDSSSSGAVHFLEDVLTRLGIPSYGQSSFTAKLKDDYLSTIQQLSSLDANDWKRLNFPVVIEEAVRKALEDRKRLLQEQGEGGRPAAGSRGGGAGKVGGGLSLKPTPPKKADKGAGGVEKDRAGGAAGGGGGAAAGRAGLGSADKKTAKKPLVAEAAGDEGGEEEEGWMDMDF